MEVTMRLFRLFGVVLLLTLAAPFPYNSKFCT